MQARRCGSGVHCHTTEQNKHSLTRSLVLTTALGSTVLTDSSAAEGIASRKGLGKVRHLEVNQLWLQDKVANKEIRIVKVPGTENVADALTKHIANAEIDWHLTNANQQIKEGRHELAPNVRM